MPTPALRRSWFPLCLALAAGLLCCPPTRGDEALAVDRLVGTRVGDFRLTNVVTGDETWFYGLAMGNRLFGQLLGTRQVKAAVLVFVSPGCPLGDKYLPRLAELAKAYEAKGVLFFGVASGAGEKADEGAKPGAGGGVAGRRPPGEGLRAPQSPAGETPAADASSASCYDVVDLVVSAAATESTS